MPNLERFVSIMEDQAEAVEHRMRAAEWLAYRDDERALAALMGMVDAVDIPELLEIAVSEALAESLYRMNKLDLAPLASFGRVGGEAFDTHVGDLQRRFGVRRPSES